MRARIALIGLVFSLLALAAIVGPVSAAITMYTNEAAFTAAIEPNYYLETFANLPNNDTLYNAGGAPLAFPGAGDPLTVANGYSFSASSPDALWGNSVGYPGSTSLSPQYAPDAILLTFSSNVTAVGAYFAPLNFDSDMEPNGLVTVAINGDSPITVNDGTGPEWAFAGFTSDDPITSVVINGRWAPDNAGYQPGYDWAAVSNLYVGSVPEPGTLIIWSLLGAGSWLGMRVWRRRGPSLGYETSSAVESARQSWSPETRQAIHEMIACGRGQRG
jgi:hypothetical protein